jgi:hypothetical protein
MHCAEGSHCKRPFVEFLAALAERMYHALVRCGDKAVE